MKDFMQRTLDLVAVWGSAGLALLATVCLWRLWLVGRRTSATVTTRTGRCWRLLRSPWFGLLGGSLALIYVIQIQMAPMSRSLATLSGMRGQAVPAVAFRTVMDDAPHRLDDYQGKVVLLNLWATWCPPCVQELPVLDQLQRIHADQGLVVIALSDETAEHLRPFIAERSLELVCGYTPMPAWLQIETFRPFTLVIDRQGILREHVLGVQDLAGWEKTIRSLL